MTRRDMTGGLKSRRTIKNHRQSKFSVRLSLIILIFLGDFIKTQNLKIKIIFLFSVYFFPFFFDCHERKKESKTWEMGI